MGLSLKYEDFKTLGWVRWLGLVMSLMYEEFKMLQFGGVS